MPAVTVSELHALEILESRGEPTLRVTAVLSDGSVGEASVPSGASTGAHEAVELRDGEQTRYQGRGVRKAAANVEGEISQALEGKDAMAQDAIDRTLIELDGTAQKSRLGANAILGASLAVARAAAAAAKLPLFRYLRRLYGEDFGGSYVLPLPLMNLVNGKRHADSGLDIQEFLVLPAGADSVAEAVRAGSEIFHALRDLLSSRGHSRSVGDEGGFAPRLERNDEVFELLTRAVSDTGRAPGKDVFFGIDAAASEFYDAREHAYTLSAPEVTLSADRLVSLYLEWARRWPLRTIEDPLEQDDWDGWACATERLRAAGIQVVGDDFFVTNPERLKRGIEHKCATAVLVKLNQIGTLSETMEVCRVAQAHDYRLIISHRSGETADTFIVDLAVAVNAGQIKTGSLSRSERVEKYNRLLAIERELGENAELAGVELFVRPA